MDVKDEPLRRISFKDNIQYQIRKIQDAENYNELFHFIDMLESMINTYKDDEYEEEIKEYLHEFEAAKKKAKTPNGYDDGMIGKAKLEYKRKKFSSLISLLNRNNLLDEKKMNV